MSLIVPTDRLRRGDTLQTTGAPATLEAIENEHGDTLRLHVRFTTDFERFEIVTTADERHTVTARALLTQAQALEIAEGWASMMDASDPGRWLYSFTSTEGIENEEHRTEMLAYVDGILAGSLDQQDDSVLERADLEALRAYLAEAPTRQRFTELDAFTTSYITAALWATNDEATEAGGEPLDRNYAPVKAGQVLAARRVDDNGPDLWRTFNRIQENLIKGGLTGRSVNQETGRVRRAATREVAGIDSNTKLNQALWTLTEKMAELKGRKLAA